MTNCSTASDSVAALRAWEYELTIPGVTKIAELARAAHHVGVLSAATNGHLDRSARYRMVLAPLGVSDELRAVLTRLSPPARPRVLAEQVAGHFGQPRERRARRNPQRFAMDPLVHRRAGSG